MAQNHLQGVGGVASSVGGTTAPICCPGGLGSGVAFANYILTVLEEGQLVRNLLRWCCGGVSLSHARGVDVAVEESTSLTPSLHLNNNTYQLP